MNARFLLQIGLIVLVGFLMLRLFPLVLRAVEVAALSFGQFWWAMLILVMLIALGLFLKARRRK